jgi:tRNA G10  N-methylase Trm11
MFENMKTHVYLENTQRDELPQALKGDDVRFSESLVRHFLEEFTKPGDVVFDPFAGYGTTLVVSEVLGRVPFGIEFNKSKVEYAQSKLQQPENLIHGDTRQLASYHLPSFNFSITSPPYMNRNDIKDPLTGYSMEGKGYEAYLEDIRSIYGQLRQQMKPGGTVVIEVANLKKGGEITTLAWDIARAVSQVLHFEGEVIVCWDKYGYGYDHSYGLVYSVK